MISGFELATIESMRGIGKALCVMGIVGFTSCASLGPTVSKSPSFCEEKKSYARGKRDAENGLMPAVAIYKSCNSEEKAAATQAYKRGFESVAAETSLSSSEKEIKNSTPTPNAWVCEIEANSKVFTGVGNSQEEAIRSAQNTCGAHLQSSSCGESECRSSL